MPLLEKMEEPRLGIWRMTESVDELLALLARPADHAAFLARVTSESRRRERLASRVLLAHLLGEEPRVDYRPDGAPYLVDSPYCLSVSHTRGYAAVQVGKFPVGIDIEYRSERVRKIRDRFLSPEESAAIGTGEGETERLLVYWCAKEALFKRVGQEEVVDFQNDLLVEPFPLASSGTLWARARKTSSRYPFAYRVEAEYVLVYSLFQ